MTMIKGVLGAAVVAVGVIGSAPALTESPKPLTIIVPLGKGGALDQLARRAAKYLPLVSDFTVQVENILIKGQSDGYRDFLERPGDGHTILAWFAPAVTKYEQGVDLDDLALINVQEIEAPILAIRSNLGLRDFDDFVEAARADPGGLRIGAGKAGGNLLITGRQFEALGIDVREVDYASGGKAREGLLNGEIELTIGSLKAIKKLGNKVIPLAMMSPKRLRHWASVPSIVSEVRRYGAPPIFGASYRFFAVRSEVAEREPAAFRELVEAFQDMTANENYKREAGGTHQWFGPQSSQSLLARAHAHFLELRRDKRKRCQNLSGDSC